jgi:hypothetical protein
MKQPKYLKFFLLLSPVLLLVGWQFNSVPVTAQSPRFGGITTIAQENRGIVLELTTAGYQVETILHQGQRYQRLLISDTIQTETAGQPQLPTRGILLGVSGLNGIALEVLEVEYETLRDYRIYPSPRLERLVSDDPAGPVKAEPVFFKDDAIYSTDAFFPAQPVALVETGLMRDQAVAQVQFNPVLFNPVSGEVRVYRRIRARLSWEPTLSIAAGPPKPVSPAYEAMLQQSLLNYDALVRPPLSILSSDLSASDNDISAQDTVSPTLKMAVSTDGIYKLSYTDLDSAGLDPIPNRPAPAQDVLPG